ncbi:hypothetical protein BJ742DRAFT_897976, partial [Cladochytrium replicatum]
PSRDCLYFAHNCWFFFLKRSSYVVGLPSAKWYKSAKGTVFKDWGQSCFHYCNRGAPRHSGRHLGANVLDRDFKGTFYTDSAAAQQVFIDHNEEVKRFAKEHGKELLVYEVSQGWEPICEFLGVPVPDVPFPKVNDTEEFNARIVWMRVVDRALIALLV